MQIPLMLVWFGVLEPQNKNSNLGVSMEMSLGLKIQVRPSRVPIKKFELNFQKTKKFYYKENSMITLAKTT